MKKKICSKCRKENLLLILAGIGLILLCWYAYHKIMIEYWDWIGLPLYWRAF